MRDIKISLIVLNYNGIQHLKEYFESVFNQTVVPDEVFMMDNNSTDDSQKYVKQNFPKVTIIANTFNAGTAEGSNIAFTFTKGEYIIFQSNDIKLDKNCVKALVETIEKDKTIGICTSVLLKYFKDNKGRHLIDNAGGISDKYGFGMQKYPDKEMKNIPIMGEVFFSYGGSFIIRREIFEKVGGFDNRYFTLNDDIDLSWRVRLLGYRIMYNKKSFIYHKVSATLGPLFDRPIKRYWSERNSMRTLIKNYSSLQLLTLFPKYFVLLIAEMGYFLLRKRISLFFSDLKAIIWNIFNLPDTLRMRSLVQKMKKNNNVEKIMIKDSLKIRLFQDFKKAI